ncbi:interferon-induced protein 44-like isoform X3 [Esox lucius]|uniref:interferon-induced protein 44-like isoform X3 n=1 Tax=Esox lucius TaxID=8010 RepID=UPI0010BD545D|nr:interferon-induced protein 44-like isoform X3 [Esox lucius]
MKKTLNLRLRTYKKCKHEWGTFSTKGKEKRNAMVNELKNMKLNNPDMEQLRCLLIGPIGAGKSSFINSVKSVFQGYMAHGALAAALSSKGFTNTYKTCYIRNGTNRLPFALSDVMGLEPSEGYGIHPDDIINALKGHLPNGYKMQTCSNELGVPVNCILPVKNYHEEVGLDNDMDILILNAISQIMNFANDCI